MTDTLVHLESYLAVAEARAQRHFEVLMECVKTYIPDFMWDALPKVRDDIGGLFTSSQKSVYIIIFKGISGYTPMNANFRYAGGAWSFENFTLELGIFSRVIFEAETFEDAALLSRQYDKLKPTAGPGELATMPSSVQ